jgi:sporulation protein YhbH
MSIFQRHKTIADRSAGDRSRHRKKIERAIKDGIYNIVAEESIIGKEGKKKFRIPVRGIKEYRFVYGDNGSKRVGSAQGKDVKRGQVIGKKEEAEVSDEGEAGNQRGEEYYEVELTLDQLSEYLFKDLELPNFEKKKNMNVVSKKIKRHGYRSKGIRPRLDKKKTVIEKLKRKNKSKFISDTEKQEEESFPFHDNDLKYRHYKVHEKKSSNAVIFFLMDISGSMSKSKKYLARSFFFLLYHFIRARYDKVDLVFIAHDIEAYEVTEEQFFGRGSSGGTLVSSALGMTDNIIASRYHPASWNIYIFQCSDGDNWPTDNQKTTDIANRLLDKIQFFGYCQIEPNTERASHLNHGSLQAVYQPLIGQKFKTAEVGSKEHIWPAFRAFFGNDL